MLFRSVDFVLRWDLRKMEFETLHVNDDEQFIDDEELDF